MPFSRSTYRYAAAIIAAACDMLKSSPSTVTSLFFIPENGIARSQCVPPTRASRSPGLNSN